MSPLISLDSSGDATVGELDTASIATAYRIWHSPLSSLLLFDIWKHGATDDAEIVFKKSGESEESVIEPGWLGSPWSIESPFYVVSAMICYVVGFLKSFSRQAKKNFICNSINQELLFKSNTLTLKTIIQCPHKIWNDPLILNLEGHDVPQMKKSQGKTLGYL